MTSLPDYDVIIVGGGMVGACVALGMAREDIRIAIIEAVQPDSDQQPSYDDRGIALSLSSRRVLECLQVWDNLNGLVTPVASIHVSDQDHFGSVHLSAAELQVPALGYVVLARELGGAVMKQINRHRNIDLICPASVSEVDVQEDSVTVSFLQDGTENILSSRLLVAADGSTSRVRMLLGIESHEKDYGQTAIVCNITPQLPHRQTAWERFTTHGPLALLPLNDSRCAVVHTVKQDIANHVLAMDDEEYCKRLQEQFGLRLGRLQRPGVRKSYPVRFLRTHEQVRDRVIILGNAAHTVHPNGAQGFNLCLRDIAGLLEVLLPVIQAGGDIGARSWLEQYRLLREPDQVRIYRFTDGLAGLFYTDRPVTTCLRNSAMWLLDGCLPLKREFMRMATGLYGAQPAMVRGSAL